MKHLYRSLAFIFLSTFGLLFLIQIEILVFYLWSANDGVFSLFKDLGILLVGQGWNLMLAICLSGIYWIGYQFKVIRILVFILLFLYTFFLIFDQIFYSNFFDHIQLGYTQGEANFTLLFDSFMSQLGVLSVFNLIIGLLCCYIASKNILPEQSSSDKPQWLIWFSKKKLPVYGFSGLYLVVSLVLIYKHNQNNLLTNPLFTLINSYWNPQKIDFDKLASEYDPVVYDLQYDQNKYEENPDIKSYFNNRHHEDPNVIFIILESIGAINLFSAPEYREFDEALTPNLYKWRDHTLVYPRIYNDFPGTTRSHITIGTGGHSTSWGSPVELLDYQFAGPTFVNSFKEKGYETSLFSSLILVNTDKFYNQLPFDYKFIPSLIDPEIVLKESLNSWGLNEDYIFSNAIEWIKNRNEERPYFLQLLTSCTHHPYSTPQDYHVPFSGFNESTRYQNALHYTDNVIGRLIDSLNINGELDNTILVITGDHGQAFGEIHRTNKLHRSNIYEENIRNFMLIIDTKNINKELKSKRIGGSGDIMPTTLSYISKYPKVPGQNLLSRDYIPKIQYLHNYVNPYKWGLVDGKWKFISQINDPSYVELYDLEKDPNEQNNVASDYPEQIQRYIKLCKDWYYYANQEFVSQLKDFSPQKMDVTDLTVPGPKVLKFGTKFTDQPFTELPEINPQESLFAYTTGIAFPQNVRCEYEWISPSGTSYIGEIDYDSEWSHVWVEYHGPRPLEDGKWILKISETGSDHLMIADSFFVSEEADLIKPFKPPLFTQLSFGIFNGTIPVRKQNLNPNDNIIGIIEGPLSSRKINLLLEWSEPGAQRENNVGVHYDVFEYQKGWGYGWFYIPVKQPVKEGRWRLSAYDNDTKELFLTQWFNVSSRIPEG